MTAGLTLRFTPSAKAARVSVQPLRFIAQIINTMQAAQARAAERQVERFIQSRGGRLTDNLEREVTDRFGF